MKHTPSQPISVLYVDPSFLRAGYRRAIDALCFSGVVLVAGIVVGWKQGELSGPITVLALAFVSVLHAFAYWYVVRSSRAWRIEMLESGIVIFFGEGARCVEMMPGERVRLGTRGAYWTVGGKASGDWIKVPIAAFPTLGELLRERYDVCDERIQA